MKKKTFFFRCDVWTGTSVHLNSYGVGDTYIIIIIRVIICITFYVFTVLPCAASMLPAHATHMRQTHTHNFMTLYTNLNEDKISYVSSGTSTILWFFFLFFRSSQSIQSLFYLWFFCHSLVRFVRFKTFNFSLLFGSFFSTSDAVIWYVLIMRTALETRPN